MVTVRIGAKSPYAIGMMRIGMINTLTLASLFIGASGSWVDPDSDQYALSTVSLVDGRIFDLVFSDEFNKPGRSFNDGHDPAWTAIHKDDYTNTALQCVQATHLTRPRKILAILS